MASVFPDVVIVLPGLVGSILQKDGETLWGTSPGAFWGTVAGDNLERLKMSAPDNGAEDIGDGIQATGLVPNAELIPGLWKQGGYSRLQRDLAARLGLRQGENYFEFPYDWRRDNRVAARKLARQAPVWLEAWREKSGNPEAKIVLVAHSMGGLVGRYFVECLEGWKIVRTLFSFGTPYRGAGNALGFLCNGFVWKAGPIGLFDGTEALRSFDSVYQLLPTYPFVDDGGQTLSRVSDIDLPNLDRRRAVAAAQFHAEIANARAANGNDPKYLRAGTKVRPVVGLAQPTWQSATLSQGALTMVYAHSGEDLKGDGTVPRVSAIPVEDDDASAAYFATTHSALQSVPAGLDHLKGVLTSAAIDLGKFRKSVGAISLMIADAYPADEPVLIEAVPTNWSQTLEGRLQRLDAETPATRLTLRPTNGVFSTELQLAPGLYGVSVGDPGTNAVEDIFLVVDQGHAA